jgi:hypothetical protein
VLEKTEVLAEAFWRVMCVLRSFVFASVSLICGSSSAYKYTMGVYEGELKDPTPTGCTCHASRALTRRLARPSSSHGMSATISQIRLPALITIRAVAGEHHDGGASSDSLSRRAHDERAQSSTQIRYLELCEHGPPPTDIVDPGDAWMNTRREQHALYTHKKDKWVCRPGPK